MWRFRILGGGLVLVVITVQGLAASPQDKAGDLRVPAVHIPALQATSFTDQEVRLPQSLQGKVGVLVVGFTRGSQDAVAGWGKRLGADYHDSTNVLYYEMPVLAGVPRMMRNFVIGKIRGSVPTAAKAHFVPILDAEASWRAVTNYEGGDGAYVMVVDSEGVVRWQTHQAASDTTYTALKQRIEDLRAKTGRSAQ